MCKYPFIEISPRLYKKNTIIPLFAQEKCKKYNSMTDVANEFYPSVRNAHFINPKFCLIDLPLRAVITSLTSSLHSTLRAVWTAGQLRCHMHCPTVHTRPSSSWAAFTSEGIRFQRYFALHLRPPVVHSSRPIAKENRSRSRTFRAQIKSHRAKIKSATNESSLRLGEISHATFMFLTRNVRIWA